MQCWPKHKNSENTHVCTNKSGIREVRHQGTRLAQYDIGVKRYGYQEGWKGQRRKGQLSKKATKKETSNKSFSRNAKGLSLNCTSSHFNSSITLHGMSMLHLIKWSSFSCMLSFDFLEEFLLHFHLKQNNSFWVPECFHHTFKNLAWHFRDVLFSVLMKELFSMEKSNEIWFWIMYLQPAANRRCYSGTAI